MGRQGGIARFTGSFDDINCYFDGDMAIARFKSTLTKERWAKLDTMGVQRHCTKGFGAAAVIAGCLWRMLPAGMRRLADGSGYGRLVGACRQLVGEDGQLYDAELLRRLDLNLGGMGPHGVKSEKIEARDLRLEASEGKKSEKGKVKCGAGFRLEGMGALMAEIDAAEGGTAGKMPVRYVMAEGVGPRMWDSEEGVRERLEAESERFWGRVAEGALNTVVDGPRRRRIVDSPVAGGHGLGLGVERRVRVWVHASRVVDVRWDAYKEAFVAAEFCGGNGFVSDWMMGSGEWADAVAIDGMDWLKELKEGVYVVFTAIEVAEKRGRHWVRLPWCCKFGVQDVVEVMEGIETPDGSWISEGAGGAGRGERLADNVAMNQGAHGAQGDTGRQDRLKIGRGRVKGVRAGP
jgi:hypothetical protein